MDAMSPQQDHVGQGGRSSSLTGGSRLAAASDSKKVSGQQLPSLSPHRHRVPFLARRPWLAPYAQSESRPVSRPGEASLLLPVCDPSRAAACRGRAGEMGGGFRPSKQVRRGRTAPLPRSPAGQPGRVCCRSPSPLKWQVAVRGLGLPRLLQSPRRACLLVVKSISGHAGGGGCGRERNPCHPRGCSR